LNLNKNNRNNHLTNTYNEYAAAVNEVQSRCRDVSPDSLYHTIVVQAYFVLKVSRNLCWVSGNITEYIDRNNELCSVDTWLWYVYNHPGIFIVPTYNKYIIHLGVFSNACRIEYNSNVGEKTYSLFDEDLCTRTDRNRHSCSHPLTHCHVKTLRNPKIRTRVRPNRPRNNPTSVNQVWLVWLVRALYLRF